jgi:hypothetical protein
VKKKHLILILPGLAVLAGICWQFTRPVKAIPVHGNLSAKDVADIRRVVEQDMRRRILTDFSWKSLKALPANARNYFKYKITEINTDGPKRGNALAVVRLNPHNTFVDVYWMSNNDATWKQDMILHTVLSARVTAVKGDFTITGGEGSSIERQTAPGTMAK